MLLGFLPGLVIALGLYRLTTLITNLPMDMSLARIVAVLLLSVTMCALSGLAALLKLKAADPADLY